SLVRRSLEDFDAQAAVVHLGIEEFGSAGQPTGFEFWKLAAQLCPGNRPATLNVVPARKQIVKRQTEPPFPWPQPASLVKRQKKTYGQNQMGSFLQKQPASMQRFINEVKAAVLQIAKAAVNQLRGHAAGSRGKIALVDQGDAKAA